MPLCAFAKNYKLHLRTFYTSDTSLKVDAIPDDSFEPNSYVNSYNGEAVCWVESYIPMSQIFSDDGTIYNFILFNQEPLQCAEIYFLDGQNKWRFAGTAGEGLESSKRIRPFCYNSIDIHEETLKNLWTDFIRVRIKISSYRSTLLELYLVSSQCLTQKNLFQISYFTFILGGCIITIFYIIYLCIIFKEYDSFLIPLINTILMLKILVGAGISNPLLITQSPQFYNSVYFTLSAVILCAFHTLKNANRPVINNFPADFQKIDTYFPLFIIIIATVGILYIVIPVESQYIHIAVLSVPVLLNVLFTANCLTSLKYNPVIRKEIVFLWITATHLIIFEQLFLSIRFLPNTTVLCRLFDNDFEIPTIFTFALISAATLRKMHFQIRTNLASIQITSETIHRQIQNDEKRNFLLSKLISELLNPIQNLHFTIEKNSGDIPEGLLLQLKKSLNSASQSIDVINIITQYTLEKTNGSLEKEPVLLKDFIDETLAPEIINLKLRNCYTDIKYNISSDATVLVDKSLFAVFLKFLLQTAAHNAKPESTIMISISYENMTLSYKIHFYSAQLSIEDSAKLISLDPGKEQITEEEKQQFESLIKSWGIQLHIAKRILDLFHGTITILPDADGNSISASTALEQTASTATPYIEKLFMETTPPQENDEIQNAGNTEFPELIYIMEEDVEVREEIRKLLSPFYKTVAFANGNDFSFQHSPGFPDLILCSITLPGKNAFDILEENQNKLSLPFIVLSKSLTRNMQNRLFSLGAFDIIQKPFDEKRLLEKINSIMSIRRNYTNELLERIENTVRTSVFDKNPYKEAVSEKEQPVPAVKTVPADSSASFTAVCISAGLTKKETDIAHLIAKGLSDKEIAEKAAISPSTVAVHNKKIFKKLGVHSRAELIRLSEQ